MLSVLALTATCLLSACVSKCGQHCQGTKCHPTDNVAPVATPAPVPALAPLAPQLKAVPDKAPDVIFVPTPQEAVERMLALAEIKPGELVYDLGCGDGRIVVTAAKKFGVRAVGVDIDPERVAESRENVRTNNVGHLVTILHADIFDLDLSKADVVTLYLLPSLNVKLMPQLRKLKPGSRIVSYEFDMQGAKPAETVTETVPGEEFEYTLYKWVVPWQEE
jgi:SAM-dependent methyltransferase